MAKKQPRQYHVLPLEIGELTTLRHVNGTSIGRVRVDRKKFDVRIAGRYYYRCTLDIRPSNGTNPTLVFATTPSGLRMSMKLGCDAARTVSRTAAEQDIALQRRLNGR